MKLHIAVPAAVLLLGSVGCAHMPDTTVGYYLSKAQATVKVTRTITCDTDQVVVMVMTATPTVNHVADRFVQVPLTKLKSGLANTDVKFGFLADGRLSTVNADATGKGEDILKAAITLGTKMTFATVPGAKKDPAQEPPKTPCEIIKGIDEKPFTLTYEGEIPFDKEGAGPQQIDPVLDSALRAVVVQQAIGTVCVEVKAPEQPAKAPIEYSGSWDGVLLPARQPAWMQIKVTAGLKKGSCVDSTAWQGEILAGQRGFDYQLRIPSAALFGSQKFAAEFEASGALKTIQYVSNTGAGEVLNVVNHGITEYQGRAAKEAERLNAESSLIAAQEKYAKCLADRKQCN